MIILSDTVRTIQPLLRDTNRTALSARSFRTLLQSSKSSLTRLHPFTIFDDLRHFGSDPLQRDAYPSSGMRTFQRDFGFFGPAPAPLLQVAALTHGRGSCAPPSRLLGTQGGILPFKCDPSAMSFIRASFVSGATRVPKAPMVLPP